MNFNEFAKEVHENAVDHGWWEESRSFGEIVALCHSELSEALEEYRSGKPMVYVVVDNTCTGCSNLPDVSGDGICKANCPKHKPEGIAVELADCIIRILDWCGKEGIDIESILRIKHEYNKTRPYKHGGKVI